MVIDSTSMTEVIHLDRSQGTTRPWSRSSTDEAGIGFIIVDGIIVEIDMSQAWFWTKEWQAGEQEVDEHIRLGEYEEFDSLEALFNSLDTPHA
ncbi:MAG: hypothetical protein HYZ26_07180 [Chloroflexi bacterium]|nr:hypothetical protein [Chloroflexota bacterium]